jgi:hypothetical protein
MTATHAAARTMTVTCWSRGSGQVAVSDPAARREDREAVYDVGELATDAGRMPS